MEISHIDIQYYAASGNLIEAGVTARKSLPYLSVVQSVTGQYGISIDGGIEKQTVPGGCFIAPAHKRQDIIHYGNGGHPMECQWLFLDVVLNRKYHLDDLYDFPLILPQQWNAEAAELIRIVRANVHICDSMAACCRLVKILLTAGQQKKPAFEPVHNALEWMHQHYPEPVTINALAGRCGLSPSRFHHLFKQAAGKSPVQYLNDYRLSVASLLLETSEKPVHEIASEIGFENQFYFSRLFKEKYALCPTHYRRKFQNPGAL